MLRVIFLVDHRDVKIEVELATSTIQRDSDQVQRFRGYLQLLHFSHVCEHDVSRFYPIPRIVWQLQQSVLLEPVVQSVSTYAAQQLFFPQ